MAMSLEDLLAEEGFKRRNAKIKPRSSFGSDGRGKPLYNQQRDKNEPVRRTERTRSDIPRYTSKAEFATSSSFTPGTIKPRDNLTRLSKRDSGSVKYERRVHRDSWDAQDSRGSEITQSDEIVDVATTTNMSYRDVYSNKAYAQDGNTKNKNNSFKHAPPQISDNRLNKIVSETENSSDAPQLDEAAVKAIISILSGHIKRFVKDEEFRTSLHHRSFASLNFIGLNEGLNTESKVVENLEQAIEIVERAAEETATLKELKRASLQLSVITGLNSDDLKDGFTSGIPNFKLSACAHLYLSVIFTIQNKDRISAKHLLQVFCDSPLQARITLLPDLWDRLFFPHLSRLKLWYEKETRSVADSPVFTNTKVLEKKYNECLDSGTYQFATYYKDWITEGVEAPPVPVIKIPSLSSRLMPRGGLYGHTSSPVSHVSPQTMVSRKLYDEVFRHSHKSGAELEVYEEQNFDISGRSSNSPAAEDKQLILYSRDSITCTNQNFDEDDGDNLPEAEEKWRFRPESSSGVANLDENYGASKWCHRNSHSPDTPQPLQSIEHEKVPLENPEPSIQEHHENYEDSREKPSLNSIPEDFLCPLTGLLFEDPVTLETGQTFEREAIVDWFGKGYITCPNTRKTLESRAVPPVNLILKRVIDKWKTDHFEHLFALLSQEAADGNRTVSILQQLLGVFSKDERIANARRIMSFGGLQFLLRRFQSAETHEKSFIVPLLSLCIEADAGCRNVIAGNINRLNLLELLHSENLKSRTNAVLLLMELICMNRRNGVKSFLGGLHDGEIINAMDDLLVFLQTCPLEQTPLVAVVLLHLDLLSETETSNIYRQEAVDALTVAMEKSLSDAKIENKCSRALLTLGAFFSSSGKLMTEDWILKLAGFLNGPDSDVAEDDTIDTSLDAMVDSFTEDGEEEKAREKWLMSLSASLIGDGKKSFLDTLSKCLRLGSSNFVRVCLTTVAWLSFSISSADETEFQLCSFSALLPPLKRCLEYGKLVEHRILASLSLLNFSTIPECRLLLMKIGDEIGPCLENLSEVTWTAKELCTIISGQTR